jgi:phage-related minor tail protein
MAERRVSVRLSVQDVERFKANLKDAGESGQKALELIERRGKPAANELRALNAVAADVRGGLQRFAGEAGAVGSALGALGPAGLAAAAALGAVSVGLAQGIRVAAEDERQLLRLEAVLTATGHAAGLTAREIKGLALELERTTLANEQEVLGSAAVLSASGVSSAKLEQAIRLSADLTAAFDTNLAGAARRLGRALEDPIRGMQTLATAGVTVSAQQRDLITTMAEAGDVAGAQAVLLDALAAKAGGVGAGEAAGLAGAMHRAEEGTKGLLAALVEVGGAAKLVERELEVIAGAAERLTDWLDRRSGERIDVAPPPDALEALVAARAARSAQAERLRAQIAEIDAARPDPFALPTPEGLARGLGSLIRPDPRGDLVTQRAAATRELAGAEEALAQITARLSGIDADRARSEEARVALLASLREELERIAPVEERLARLRGELGSVEAGPQDAVSELRSRLLRVQIATLEKPARDALAADQQKIAGLIEDLTGDIARVGDEQAQFVARLVDRLPATASEDQRVEVAALARTLFETSRAETQRQEQIQREEDSYRERRDRAASLVDQLVTGAASAMRQDLTAIGELADNWRRLIAALEGVLDPDVAADERRRRAEALTFELRNDPLQQDPERFAFADQVDRFMAGDASAAAGLEATRRDVEVVTARAQAAERSLALLLAEEERRAVRGALEERTDPAAGAQRALMDIEFYAGDVADAVEYSFVSAFRAAEDALVEFASTGRIEFSKLVQSILADLARIWIRQRIIGPIADALGSALGGAFGGGGPAGAPSKTPINGTFHAGSHGALGPNDLTRLHGMGADEGVIVARRGEHVLTGMQADLVAAALARPSVVVSGGGRQPIEFNLIDRAGVQAEATQRQNSDGSLAFDITIERKVLSVLQGPRAGRLLNNRFGLTPRPSAVGA